jgi:hypothetical protein
MNSKTKLDVWNIDYIEGDKMNIETLTKSTGEIEEWEMVPDEDVSQDGKISYPEIMTILFHQVVQQGVWKLIRKKE